MAQPYLSVTIMDGKGKTAVVRAYSKKLLDADFQHVTLPKTYEAMGDNILQDLEPVIDGQILDAEWRVPVALDFTPQTADPDSDVEEGAMFTFQTDGGFLTEMRIPTFKESLLVAGTDLVDTADSDVLDFVNTILDGPDGVAGVGEDRVDMTDNRGQDIHALVTAQEAFRRRTRRRHRIFVSE